jgi:UDP-glucuronate 4-epimerase
LAEHLLNEGGWQITVVDDLNDFYSPSIKRGNIAALVGKPEFRFIEADIRDVGAMARVFENAAFDCIVHLAARAGVRPSLLEPRLYQETNVVGTVNLL